MLTVTGYGYALHSLHSLYTYPRMQWAIAIIAILISFLVGNLPIGYVLVRALHGILIERKPADITASGVRRRFGWGWALLAVLADAVKCLAGGTVWFVLLFPSDCGLRLTTDEYGNSIRDLNPPYWIEDTWWLGMTGLLIAAAVAGHAWHHWRKPKAKTQPANS